MLKYLLAFACAYLIAITVSVIYQVEKSQQAKRGNVIILLPLPTVESTGNPIWLQPSQSLTKIRQRAMWLRNPV